VISLRQLWGLKASQKEVALNCLLTQLSYRSEDAGQSLASKKYNKHVCFMFELFFAVSLEPSKNMTHNLTCEWQLRLYSKRHSAEDIVDRMYDD
jgi:hypothetical protein